MQQLSAAQIVRQSEGAGPEVALGDMNRLGRRRFRRLIEGHPRRLLEVQLGRRVRVRLRSLHLHQAQEQQGARDLGCVELVDPLNGETLAEAFRANFDIADFR